MTLINSIKNATSVLIIGHVRPDGDCIGAGLAVKSVCKNHGVSCDFVFDSPVPEHFSFLPDYAELNVQNNKSYDLVIAVDCGDDLRTGKYIGYVKKAKQSYNIDHHISNNRFALVNEVRPDACSTCEVLYDMLCNSGEIDDTVAYYLFVGLSTDTGHFVHSNVTSHVFEIAADLCKHNINPHAIADNLYKNTSYNRVALISRAIQSMKFFADRKICVISIRLNDLSDCGCVLADTEGIIDYAMMISGVEVGLCICEQNSPQFKVSYRSKGLDVGQAAAVFGGGGHKLAAGCQISGKYEDVLRKAVKSVTDGMPL